MVVADVGALDVPLGVERRNRLHGTHAPFFANKLSVPTPLESARLESYCRPVLNAPLSFPPPLCPSVGGWRQAWRMDCFNQAGLLLMCQWGVELHGRKLFLAP